MAVHVLRDICYKSFTCKKTSYFVRPPPMGLKPVLWSVHLSYDSHSSNYVNKLNKCTDLHLFELQSTNSLFSLGLGADLQAVRPS